MIEEKISRKTLIARSKMMQSLETEGKLHKCPSCHLSYSRKYYLNRHIKTAHLRYLTTQIVCEICQVNFSRKEHLIRHTRNKHSPISMTSVSKEKSSQSNTLCPGEVASSFTAATEYSFDSIQSENDKEVITKTEPFCEGGDNDPLSCSSPFGSANVLLNPNTPSWEIDSKNNIIESLGIKKYKALKINEDPFTERNGHCSSPFDSANVTSEANSENSEVHESGSSMRNKNLDKVKGKIDSFSESRNGTCWSPFDGTHVASVNNIDSWEVDTKVNTNGSLLPEELPTIKLIRKIVNNDPERAYHCTVCKMSYCRKYHLDRHMRSVHSNAPHECHMCSSKFTRNDHLSRHLKKRHDVVMDRLLKCYQCSECFKTKDERRTHYQLTHLRCPHCHKCFKKSDHLTRHIRLVHKMTGKLHQCEHCSSAFVRKDNLLKHEQKQHPEFREDAKTLSFLGHSIFDVCS